MGWLRSLSTRESQEALQALCGSLRALIDQREVLAREASNEREFRAHRAAIRSMRRRLSKAERELAR